MLMYFMGISCIQKVTHYFCYCLCFYIFLIVDTIPPTVIYCPNNTATSTELGTDGTNVTWREPEATDLSGTPRQIRTHDPSSKFLLGETLVTYSFVDTSNNTAKCNFTITVYTGMVCRTCISKYAVYTTKFTKYMMYPVYNLNK